VSENPNAAAIVDQSVQLWRSSFRLATAILRQEQPLTWEEREQKERYYTMVPMIAAKLYDDALSNGAFLQQVPEQDQDRRISGMAAVISEMDRASGEAEKAAKEA